MRLTPKDAAIHAPSISDQHKWLAEASAREIQEFIQNIPVYLRPDIYQHARTALEVRVGEDMLKASERVERQTSSLIEQTNRLVEETVTLRNFAEIQVKLAHKMDRLTKWLIGLTLVLVVLTLVLLVFAGVQTWMMQRDNVERHEQKQAEQHPQFNSPQSPPKTIPAPGHPAP